MKLRTALAILLCLGCGSSRADLEQLSKEDVEKIIAQAVTEASRINRQAVIAVTDREGFILGVWDTASRIPTSPPDGALFKKKKVEYFGLIAGAVTRASTAAFLSSNQNAFTSRTAGFIIQQHFPPGVRNTPPGPLVGVGFSNLFYSDVNRVKTIPDDVSLLNTTLEQFATRPNLTELQGISEAQRTNSPGARGGVLPFTSLNDSPGGVPLYKGDTLVGGIGVTGDGGPTDLAPAAAIFREDTQKDATTGFKAGEDLDEEVALAGQTGYRPSNGILATRVLINGIRVPYVHRNEEDIRDVDGVKPLGDIGRAVTGFDPAGATLVIPVTDFAPKASPPPFPFQVRAFGGIKGEIRIPFRDDPLPGKIRGASRITKEEVADIVAKAAERCRKTRAGIRLPLGVSANVWIVVVNNPNQDGVPPTVLGTFRVADAPMFSWDVATQKARSALFFSNDQLAMSSRSIGWLAQRYYPPGLDGRKHGPLFGFQEAVSLRINPATPLTPPNPNLPNGLTIFPGGFPLYRNGQIVGAIGVSGDGVDQDDIIGASGCRPFLPELNIRADQYLYRGARIPYAKFPRDPVR